MHILDRLQSPYNLSFTGLHQINDPVTKRSAKGLMMLFSVLNNLITEKLQSVTELITSLQTTLAGSTNTAVYRNYEGVVTLLYSLMASVQENFELAQTSPNVFLLYIMLPLNTCLLLILIIMVKCAQIVIAYSFECWSSSGGFGVRAPTMSTTNSQSSSLQNVGATPGPCGGGL